MSQYFKSWKEVDSDDAVVAGKIFLRTWFITGVLAVGCGFVALSWRWFGIFLVVATVMSLGLSLLFLLLRTDEAANK